MTAPTTSGPAGSKAPPMAEREALRPYTPKLVELTHEVLFGDVWERPGLSKRDRSLITVAALIAAYRPEQLKVHMDRALTNGVTREELAEAITHLAFYAGWPSGMTAAGILRGILEARGQAGA